MNYEQARQIAPDAQEGAGKWNWTNFNDSIADHPYTTTPCRNPSFGKTRCDHDTQEEAERHRYEFEASMVRIREVDLDTLPARLRCEYPGCGRWQTHESAMTSFTWASSPLCEEHATMAAWREIHPFVPGMQEVHS